MQISQPLPDRFVSKFVECPTTGCWLWTAHADKQGYGHYGVWRKGTMPMQITRAHQYVWVVLNGPVPDGFEIDHRCGCKSCVNPDHLRLATRSQNRMNIGKPKNNKSGQKGVIWVEKESRWLAYIGVDRKQIKLGRFKSFDEAVRARNEATSNLHGNFSNAN